MHGIIINGSKAIPWNCHIAINTNGHLILIQTRHVLDVGNKKLAHWWYLNRQGMPSDSPNLMMLLAVCRAIETSLYQGWRDTACKHCHLV